MHPTEFFLVFAWLVSLSVVLGLTLLRLWHLRGPTPRRQSFWSTAAAFDESWEDAGDFYGAYFQRVRS